jgi:hypothetical protein
MRVIVVLIVAVGAFGAVAALMVVTRSSSDSVGDSKTACAYPASSQKMLADIESTVGTTFDCVLLFNNAKPNWSTWTNVWFGGSRPADQDWVQWANASPNRTLVISQAMVPADAPADWRVLGARGAYDRYARQLADNLVAEGLGHSVIRLGWEANDGADAESALGTNPSEYRDWALYWARVVRAMRSVKDAHFVFDWTVNQGYRPIALADWYPGDSVVDIIGIDAYDGGIGDYRLTPAQRWSKLSQQPDGLDAVAAFAVRHHKALSVPEWGLLREGSSGGGGDDPTYVAGIARFVATHAVAYQSYFDHGTGAVLPIEDARASLVEYRDHLAHLGSETLRETG